MDVLSEVLKVVKLQGAMFFNGEFSSPWSVCSPPSHAVAPYLAARLGEIFNPHVPFFVGAAAIILALVVLVAGGRHLGRIDAVDDDEIEAIAGEPMAGSSEAEAEAISS